jgi:hypothetical protein
VEANWCWVLSFVDICIVVGGDPIIKRGRFEIPLTGLTSVTFLNLFKTGPGFPTSYVVVFLMFNDFRREAIVHFVEF